MVLCIGITAVLASPAAPDDAPPAAPPSFTETLPGSGVTIEMVPLPPAAKGGPIQWMSRTEVTWDAYDTFVFRLDEEAGAGAAAEDAPREAADAVSRPTRPYIAADRGFGHAGHPAISISAAGAEAFCDWLSRTSGRTYRLPTEAEWERACKAGALGEFAVGEDPGALAAHAWFDANAEGRTHPVATRTANAWGLHDMHGNAAEWVVAADGAPVMKGGCYKDPPARLETSARRVPTGAWNASDPNVPKSRWWLADAPFAGFRVLCEGPPPAAPKPETPPDDPGD